jgi:probable rRNA maturation factor
MIETIIEDEDWRSHLPEAEALAVQCFNAAVGVEPALCGDIALLLTNDEALQSLNAKFLGKDKPTNVLSFPSGDDKDFLGDIALARETTIREAQEAQIPLRHHAAHLIVHGMLHLTGHDHVTDTMASEMEHREVEILERLGVANPYINEVAVT